MYPDHLLKRSVAKIVLNAVEAIHGGLRHAAAPVQSDRLCDFEHMATPESEKPANFDYSKKEFATMSSFDPDMSTQHTSQFPGIPLLDHVERALGQRKLYSLADLTMIVAVRLHSGNPWAAERLELMGQHYNPKPKIIVCDFGSEGSYALRVADICKRQNFDLVYIDDNGVFSASSARNFGFSYSKTDLVFFNDVDVFFKSNFFSKLIDHVNDLKIQDNIYRFIDIPVYHLAENFENWMSMSGLSLCESFSNIQCYQGFLKENALVDFAVPYSNIFMCHRDLFSMVGGYNSHFRGHASEDFEFKLRYSFISGIWPMPDQVGKDFYGPLRESFYNVKDYSGFRSLFSLMAKPTEDAGLAGFHIWHPRAKDDGWISNNDWKRERFNKIIGEYISSPHKLLDHEFLPREKKALCLIRHEDHWRYQVILRAYGLGTVGIYGDSANEINKAINAIDKGDVDYICLFNPYMKSHANHLLIMEYGKSRGIKTIVIERGALPRTIYFSNFLSYEDPDYRSLKLNEIEISGLEKNLLSKYLERLAEGKDTLEANGPFAPTTLTNLLRLSARHKVLVPLQLSDDMAVNRFTEGHLSYSEFLQSLLRAAEENPDIIFIVKKHPLQFMDDIQARDNIVAAEGENIHQLIGLCDAVICYNSGVALLAALQGKPVFTVGNSPFAHCGANIRAADVSEAVARLQGARALPREDALRLVKWLFLKKYSIFQASDDIKKFEQRASHGYKNIVVTRININGDIKTGIMSVNFGLVEKSYAWGRLNIFRKQERLKNDIDLSKKNIVHKNIITTSSAASDKPIFASDKSRKLRKLRKLFRSPRQFILDAFRNRVFR